MNINKIFYKQALSHFKHPLFDSLVHFAFAICNHTAMTPTPTPINHRRVIYSKHEPIIDGVHGSGLGARHQQLPRAVWISGNKWELPTVHERDLRRDGKYYWRMAVV
jgi:hypothetical protein